MKDRIYSLMQQLDQFLADIGVAADLRSNLIEIFLGEKSFSLNFGNYSITYDGNVFFIRRNETDEYITFNKASGLMVNYSDEGKKYYFSLFDNNNYSMQINSDNNGLEHTEMYERRSNKCRYSLTEGVYTYSEIKIDSGNDTDRENLINCVESSEVVTEFKTRFMTPLKAKFPRLCTEELFGLQSHKKVYYIEKKETND